MLAEKPFVEGEKLQAVRDNVTYNFVCLVLSISACGEGDFGPIWRTLTYGVVCVCALLSHICNDLLPREP